MSGSIVVAVVVLVALMALIQTYESHQKAKRTQRHVEIGAKCAAEAGFRLEGYSGGIWGDGSCPSYTFYHGLFPDLVLHIHSLGWHIWEPFEFFPEPKFKGKRGNDFSVSDFSKIADEYQAVVAWRRKAHGWGCTADVRVTDG
jgi:hypothetical protein